MGFEQLLGNNRLKENLSRSLSRGRGGHFYLISGPQGSGKHTLARLLAAALLCGKPDAPCGHCEACRKVFSGVHPDFITVDDPEKKTVPVDLIREARGDMYIQPNEGSRKIYLFPRGQDMGIPGQNALLKILEEPPSYGVFLLLTDNPHKMLPTVRSRCTELALTPVPEQVLYRELCSRFPDADQETLNAAIARSGGYAGQAIQLLEGSRTVSQQSLLFAHAFTHRDTLGLLQVLVPMEKWKRDQLTEELVQWVELLEEALACRSGGAALSEQGRILSEQRDPSHILAAIGKLKTCIQYAQGNVSPAAICGYLQWALR
jgi:DNA polymerase-3 subunit delta'